MTSVILWVVETSPTTPMPQPDGFMPNRMSEWLLEQPGLTVDAAFAERVTLFHVLRTRPFAPVLV